MSTRTCPSCGRENATDVDFCQCGEYLRWELTNVEMPAVVPPTNDQPATAPPPATPEPPARPTAPAGRPDATLEPATAQQGPPAAGPPPPPPPPSPPPAPPEDHFVTGVLPTPPRRRQPPPPRQPPSAQQPHAPQPYGSPPPPPPLQPPPPAAQPAGQAPAASAAISLRLPTDEASGSAGPLGVVVAPGDRVRVIAHVRNQGGIVDNYSLVVHGFPSEWYTVLPQTIYLVPYGSAGTYEQEVEIHLHPPRTPEAEARRWELNVGVLSRAQGTEVAFAPMTLGIHPYEDYAIRVRPERASGRRRAKYHVTITNKANALVLLAVDAHDSDDACRFEFDRDALELRAGEAKIVKLLCSPPRQIWIGRAIERRFEISGASGEAGEQLLNDKADKAVESLSGGGGLKQRLGGGMPKIPGMTGPKVNMPQVGIGPGGKLNVRMPNVRGPQMQGVNLRRPTLGLKALKMPDHGVAPAISTAPLLPTQAIFRQKAWLPWWLAIVLPLLLLLALMLFLLLPKSAATVAVPTLIGKTQSAAQNKLDDLGLVLGTADTQPTDAKKAGTVMAQHPDPGKKAEVGSKVNLTVAVGSGKVTVPKLVGLNLEKATQALLDAKLTKGAITPPQPDLKAKIQSTIPAAGTSVAEGTPIDIFYATPGAAGGPGGKKGAGAPGAAAGPTGPKDIEVPKIDPSDESGYGKALGALGLIPVSVRRVNDAKIGTVFGTIPDVGTKVAKNTKVTMLVSAGFPPMAYDINDDIRLVNTRNAKAIPGAIAKDKAKQEKDPTWSPNGKSIVFTSDGQLMSVDVAQRDRPPTALTQPPARYGDPSYAPAGSVIAVSRITGAAANADRDLCFGKVKAGSVTPHCISQPDVTIGFAHWLPGGRAIIAPGTSAKGNGIVKYKTRKPYSANTANWDTGEFVTVPDKARFVRDAAVSPDGKHLAAVANYPGKGFQLYVSDDPADYKLTKADPLPIVACKVIWIDPQNLAIVSFGPDCVEDSSGVGQISRINIGAPTKPIPIVTGDNPTFRPLSVGG